MWWLCRGQDKVAPLQEQKLKPIVPDDNNPYGYRVHNTNKMFVCREPYDPDGRPENYVYISRRIRKKN